MPMEPPSGSGRDSICPDPGRPISSRFRETYWRDNGVTAPEITFAVPLAPSTSSWARGSLNTKSDPTGAPSSTKTSTLELSTWTCSRTFPSTGR